MKSRKTKFKKVIGAAAISATLIGMVAWMTPNTYYQMIMENDLIKGIKSKLNSYNEKFTEDRMYMQLDKPMYEPGDDIWLAAYIRDGISMKQSTKSDIVYVELINPKGTVEKKINLIAKNGLAAGDFKLDKEAVGGMYKVKAYTNWMKNFGEDNCFTKEIQVQEVVLPNLKMKLDFERKAFGAGDEVVAKLELNTNENKPLGDYKIKFVASLDGQKIIDKADVTDENGIQYIKFNLPKELATNDGLLNVMIDYNGSTESISRSIPIVLNKIDFTLFPEGGDLVSGLQSNVAFRALNEFGKPADVEGVIINQDGKEITSFSSFHQGMGAFAITPKANDNYYVKITKPVGITKQYELPKAFQRGYVMSVDNSKKDEIVATIHTTENEELSFIAQVRGKILYSTVIDAKKGSNTITFPSSAFPIGVAQFTLFDSKAIARCERLAFVNKDKQLSISVETEKEKYLPREKVKMNITVKDERGLPMPAMLSMAVVNDQLISFADDKSGNILSQLLLQQDIKEKVEEPSFYFDAKEAKADKALDYLLMTAGWRRFTWEKVVQEIHPVIAYQNERAIVSGTVMDAYTGKPIADATIKVNNGAEYTADETGKFIFNKLDLSAPVLLTCFAKGYNTQSQNVYAYNNNQVLYLYDQKKYGRWSTNTASNTGVAAFAAEGAGMVQENAPMEDDEMVLEKAKDNSKHEPRRAIATKSGVRKRSMVDANDDLAMVDAKLGKKEEKQDKTGEEQREKDAPASGKRKIADGRFRMADSIAIEGEAFNRQQNQKNINGLFLDGDFEMQNQIVSYYRTREFAAPKYTDEVNVENRTDFRNTIYWNPSIEVDKSGKASVEFFASDDITSFKATVEGIASDGTVGRGESKIFTQLPFAMTTKIPVEVATEDVVSIPLTLKNNTDQPLGGALTITAPDGFKKVIDVPLVQTIMPGKAKTIYLDYAVLDKIGYGDFTISFKACGLGDSFTQKIKIAPKGFPVAYSFSGQELEKEFSFEMNKTVNGSLRVSFAAYPNVVSDLMKGIEGILQEPYGCFEQTSCSAYPNAMVLDYLKTTDSKDNKVLARANDLLNKGYKRLTSFETKEKGYEWFGASPAHEGLTAYGIMEFVDMKNAGGDVDQKMIDRTANWLISHKDGKGGFQREKRALHDFGRISDDIMNAYIVYALAEAGYTDLKNEFNASYKRAMETKDPYMLAMMANAAYSLKENQKANDAMEALLTKQNKDGSWSGATHSITYSQGNSLTVETTSLAIMSILKSQSKNAAALSSAVKYLVGARSGYGTFSSTQGTILALKALTEYAKFSKKTTEDGEIEIYVDGKKVATQTYKAGDKGEIAVNNLESFIKEEGKHTVKVKYVGVKNPLPYSVGVNYNTSLPSSDEMCAIDLKTKLSNKTANVGETVRLTATITNKKKEEVPSTMAIIGVPAGFTIQPWQLKELQEKKVFDYYEIKGNNIAIYYRGMAPNAVKEINLDLKAEMPGTYDAPASTAYLYYTNEYKTWRGLDRVTIKKNG